MREIRVLLVDDSVMVRHALHEALEGEDGFRVCASAPNGLLGLEQLALTKPDVVVLDLEMPVVDGLEFLSRMRPEHPKLCAWYDPIAARPSFAATVPPN